MPWIQAKYGLENEANHTKNKKKSHHRRALVRKGHRCSRPLHADPRPMSRTAIQKIRKTSDLSPSESLKNKNQGAAKFGLNILLQTTHQATHITPSSPLNLFWHRFSGHIWPEPQAHAHSPLACFRGRLTSVVGFEPKILVVECRGC